MTRDIGLVPTLVAKTRSGYRSWKDNRFQAQYRITEAAEAVEAAKEKFFRLTNGTPPPAALSFNEDVIEIAQLIGVYIREVEEYNDRHPHRKIELDPSITQFSPEFEEFFAKHPIEKIGDTPKISVLPKMEPFDSKKIPELDKDGKPQAIPVSIAAQYCTQVALDLASKNSKNEIDECIRSGDPSLDEDANTIQLIESFLVMGRVIPKDGDNQHIGQAVQATILGHMLSRSEVLFLIALYEIVGPTPRVPLNNRDDRIVIQPADQARYTDLGLDHATVTYRQLQEKLATLGPEDPKFQAFFHGKITDPDQLDRLKKLAKSQHELLGKKLVYNPRIDKLNKDNVDGSGDSASLHKTLTELNETEIWTARVSALRNNKSSGLGSVAALIAADKTFDPTDSKDLDKIRDQILEVAPNENVLVDDLKSVIEASSQEVDQYFEEEGAALPVAVASHSLQAAKRYVDYTFKQRDFDHPRWGNRFDVEGKEIPPLSQSMSTIADYSASRAAGHNEIGKMHSGDKKDEAEKIVVKASALGTGLRFIVGAQEDLDEKQKNRIFNYIFNKFLDAKEITETDVRDSLIDAGVSIEKLGPIYEAIQTSLAISEGLIEAKTVNADVQTATVKELKSVGFNEVIAKRVSDRVNQKYSTDHKMGEAEIRDILVSEIKHNNEVIAGINNIKLSEIKGDNKVTSVEWSHFTKQAAIHYKNQGQVEKAAIETICKKSLSVKQIEEFYNLVQNEIKTPTPDSPLPSDLELQFPNSESFLENIEKEYSNIPKKEMQKGAVMAAKKSGVQDPATLTAIQKSIEQDEKKGEEKKDDPGSRVQIALGATKGFPSREGSYSAPLSVAAIISNDPKVLRKVHSQNQSGHHKRMTAAISSAVKVDGTKNGMGSLLALELGKKAAGSYLKNGNFDNPDVEIFKPAYESVNRLAATLFRRLTEANLGLTGLGVPANLLEEIQDHIIESYIKNNSMDNATALGIIQSDIAARRPGLAIVPPTALGPINFNNITETETGRVIDFVDHFHLKSTEQEKDILESAKEGLFIAVGAEAIDNAEAEAKGATSNYREVAGAVVVAAMSGGCTRKQALELSKKLTSHYLTNGNFDGVNFTNECKGLPAKVKWPVKRAAESAAAIPAGADPVSASTSLASKVFPLLDDSAGAGAIAALTANSLSLSPSLPKKLTDEERGINIDNAVTYAKSIGRRTQDRYIRAHGTASVAAVAAAREARNKNPSHAQYSQEIKTEINKDIRHIDTAYVDFLEELQFIQLIDELKASPEINSSLVSRDPEAINKAKTQIGKAAAVLAYVKTVGRELGLDDEEVNRLIPALSNVKALSKSRYDLSATAEAVLAMHRVDRCSEALRTIPIPHRDKNREIIRDAKQESIGNPVPTTMQGVKKSADTAFKVAKKKFGNFRTLPLDRLATAEGKLVYLLAAGKVYEDALNREADFVDPNEFKKVVKAAKNHEKAVVTAWNEFKRVYHEENPSAGPLSDFPVLTISTPQMQELLSGTCSGRIISAGVSAGEDCLADGGDEKDRIEDALTAMRDEFKACGGEEIEDTELDTLIVKVKEALDQGSSSVEKGRMAAEVLKEYPVLSEAFASVVTHLTESDPTLRAKAIDKSTRVAAIGEASALPSVPEILQNETDPAKKRGRNLSVVNDADPKLLALSQRLRKEEEQLKTKQSPLKDDQAGVYDALKNRTLNNAGSIVLNKPGEWTMNIDSTRTGKKVIKLKDMKGVQAALKRLEKCGPISTAAALKAIEAFKQEHNKGFMARLGLSSLRNITVKPNPDGTITISWKGKISAKQINAILNKMADAAEAEKLTTNNRESVKTAHASLGHVR